MFLVASVAVVVGSCSDNSSSSAPSAPDIAAPATTVPGSTTSTEVPIELPGDPFTLGVASGDPDETSVILWTRLAPDPLADGGMPDRDVPVTWEVSSDEGFATVHKTGTEVATVAHGHTVHALAEIGPGDWFYRFRVGIYTSRVGATHASPSAASPTTSVRFASASCQNYEDGFYTAHADIVEQKPEFVMWLGDYIYEGGAGEIGVDGAARSHGAPEPTTLIEYRDRYALYKLDANLQAAHATCPWFVIWDDHEVENNYASRDPQDPADATTFAERRFEAYQAWWENMPVRLDPPASVDSDFKIYRNVAWGDLLGITLLDTRQYRTDQACGDVKLSADPACPETFDTERTLTGANQEQFIYDSVGTLGTVWNVIGQQLVMSDVTLNGAVLNYDQWDGYPGSRQRLLAHLADGAVPNVVVLSGDIHLAGVGQLRNGAPGIGAPVGVEFVATSVSSSGNVDQSLAAVLAGFPDIIDAELAHRGYILHTVTPDEWIADYRIIEDVLAVESVVTTYKTFTVIAGTNTIDDPLA